MPRLCRVKFFAPGFTLVEILVVVVILGIASAIIMPQLGSRSDLEAASVARVVMSDLLYAQNLAIARQSPVYVQFTATANPSGYSLLGSISPAVALIHPVNRDNFTVVVGSASPTSGLRRAQIASASFDNRAALAFDELGGPYFYDSTARTMVPLTSGTIRIVSGDCALTLSIEPFTGEITVK